MLNVFNFDRIDGVMASVLASSTVDHGFQTKEGQIYVSDYDCVLIHFDHNDQTNDQILSFLSQEKFEDTKGVVRSRKSKIPKG